MGSVEFRGRLSGRWLGPFMMTGVEPAQDREVTDLGGGKLRGGVEVEALQGGLLLGLRSAQAPFEGDGLHTDDRPGQSSLPAPVDAAIPLGRLGGDENLDAAGVQSMKVTSRRSTTVCGAKPPCRVSARWKAGLWCGRCSRPGRQRVHRRRWCAGRRSEGPGSHRLRQVRSVTGTHHCEAAVHANECPSTVSIVSGQAESA